jgi:hypothetical protein
VARPCGVNIAEMSCLGYCRTLATVEHTTILWTPHTWHTTTSWTPRTCARTVGPRWWRQRLGRRYRHGRRGASSASRTSFAPAALRSRENSTLRCSCSPGLRLLARTAPSKGLSPSVHRCPLERRHTAPSQGRRPPLPNLARGRPYRTLLVAGSGSSLGSKEPEIKRKLVREREEG